MSTYNPVFSKIVGQQRGKQMLSDAIKAVNEGRNGLCVLFQGEKGIGKTRLMYAYDDGVSTGKRKRKLLRVQPKDFRGRDTPQWNDLVATIVSGEPYVLEIDEAHELVDENATKQTITVFNFLRRALDGNSKGKRIPFDAENDQYTVFDRSKHIICLGTNFANHLDSSGALQSRFTVLKLSHYSEAELKQITLIS